MAPSARRRPCGWRLAARARLGSALKIKQFQNEVALAALWTILAPMGYLRLNLTCPAPPGEDHGIESSENVEGMRKWIKRIVLGVAATVTAVLVGFLIHYNMERDPPADLLRELETLGTAVPVRPYRVLIDEPRVLSPFSRNCLRCAVCGFNG